MKKTLNNRTLIIISHTLTWLFVAFIMGLLWVSTWPRGVELPSQLFIRMGILFILLVIAFYMNYSVLVEKLLFQNRTWQYLAAAFLLLIGTVLLSFLINNWLLEPRFRMVNLFFSGETSPEQGMFITGDTPQNRPQGRVIISTDSTLTRHRMHSINPDSVSPGLVSVTPRMSFFFFMIRGYSMVWLSVLFVLAAGTSIKLSLHRLRTERQKEQANREKLSAELSFLKSQINPHFFFNMLNNIYSLIQSSPATAQQAVHKLSKLMRYVLYDSSKELVPLQSEIEFIESYIELAKIRLSAATTVRFDHSITNPDTPVPPLLTIPFLENVFKHGVRQNESSTIAISLIQTKESITFTSQNSIFDNQKPVYNEGIGLNNVQRRLDLLYDDDYSLIITEKAGFFKVHLTIPVYENQMHSH